MNNKDIFLATAFYEKNKNSQFLIEFLIMSLDFKNTEFHHANVRIRTSFVSVAVILEITVFD